MKILNSFKRNLSFLFFVLGLFAFRWSLADQYQVPSGSMEPTIEVGDRILVNKMAYDLKIPFTPFVVKSVGEPQRGDIIVFDNPKNGVCMVKRLIALPGDHVMIKDGFVSINGEWMPGTSEGLKELEKSLQDEMFYSEFVGSHKVQIKRTASLFRAHSFEFTVPVGKYFAMGDNRDNSLDSRSWGFLSREDLKGRAWGVFYNLSFNEHWLPSMKLERIGHSL